MAIRTWVGRFCVADGRVEEEGPWLGSLIRQRTDEEADELYVLIEPASPASAEFTSQLVDVKHVSSADSEARTPVRGRRISTSARC